jgi:hypothetical protein
VRRADLATFICQLSKSGSLKLLEPSGPVLACNGIALPLALLFGVCAQCQYGWFLKDVYVELSSYVVQIF